MVWYEGLTLTSQRYLVTDERGSVIAGTDGSGATLFKNVYDEYGRPGSANQGRFQYTGQMWLAEAGLYHYKARIYDPGLGRFLQTDPIGYADGLNLYAYVGGDPVNATDPTGTLARGFSLLFGSCAGRCVDANGNNLGNFNEGGLAGSLFGGGGGGGGGRRGSSNGGATSTGFQQLGGFCIGAFGPCSVFASRGSFSIGGFSFFRFGNNFQNGTGSGQEESRRQVNNSNNPSDLPAGSEDRLPIDAARQAAANSCRIINNSLAIAGITTAVGTGLSFVPIPQVSVAGRALAITSSIAALGLSILSVSAGCVT